MPAFRHVPPAKSREAGDQAIELAAAAGLFLDPWEEAALRDALGEDDDGRWSSLRVGLVCPRQNGKGSVLEARTLAGLFLFDERLITHSAHQFKTATEAFVRINSLIDGCPDLSKQVKQVYTGNGKEAIELLSGQRLKFVARSKSSGKGFSGDCVLLDEAQILSDKAIAALMPTISAQPNPQIWYTANAPLDTEESDVLRRFCRRGRQGGDRLTYIEYCAEPEDDPRDEATWAKANPGYGIRLNPDVIRAEVDDMAPDDFARERLGIWREEGARQRIIPVEDWIACQEPTSTPIEPLFFGLDVAPERTSASIGLAGMRVDGKVHVETVESREGVGWVVGRLSTILRNAKVDSVCLSPNGPAGALLNDLGLAGIKVTTCGTTESAQACGAFYDGIIDRTYRHIGEPLLSLAVDAAQKRRQGDAWVWDRRSSAADVTPLIAVTLAAWALHATPIALEPSVIALSDFVED